MSILDRLTSRHLDDAALVAIWTRTAAAGRTSDGGTALADPHVATCAECRVRFDALASWMEEIRSDARLESDDAFPPERLAAQQAAIFRRIEASERPARVIAFPKYPVGGVTRSAPVRRWVAAAAAAGLLVGVGVGQLMDFRHSFGPRGFAPIQQTRAEPVRAVTPVNTSISEEALLLELEAAATPHYEALRAFETMTPRAADVLASSR